MEVTNFLSVKQEGNDGSGGVGGRLLDSPLASALFTAFLVLMVEHADELGDLAQFWMTVLGSTAACATTCAMNSKASATATAAGSARRLARRHTHADCRRDGRCDSGARIASAPAKHLFQVYLRAA